MNILEIVNFIKWYKSFKISLLFGYNDKNHKT